MTLRTARNARSERRVVLLLPVLFGLTIVTFVLATTIAQRRTSQIAADAHSVSTLAAPSIYHLSNARTELRRLEVLLFDYVDRTARHADTGDVARRVEDSRRALDRAWATYLLIPTYPGERALFAQATEARRRESASVDELTDDLRRGDVAAAQVLLTQETRTRIEAVDDLLLQAIDLNARMAADSAARIETAAHSSRMLAIALNAVSAVLAAVAGVVVARATIHHLRSMNTHVAELEHFAGRVAHDIRSPLASVALALDLARAGRSSEDRVRGALARGTKALQRVGQLVDGLLLFAVAGARPARNAHVSVPEVVGGVVDEFAPAAREKQIELRVDRVDRAEVACSPGVLVSLLSNLLGNAIKYMGAAAVRTIGIRAIARDDTVRFEVEDTGPGVPPDLRTRIFDPYVRATDGTDQGFGLGLATVRRLVEAHGGQTGLEARQPGSLFWFVLPQTGTSSPAG
jgi:signal transduction histidine kinase